MARHGCHGESGSVEFGFGEAGKVWRVWVGHGGLWRGGCGVVGSGVVGQGVARSGRRG